MNSIIEVDETHFMDHSVNTLFAEISAYMMVTVEREVYQKDIPVAAIMDETANRYIWYGIAFPIVK